MKKTLLYIFCAVAALSLSSCFDDDSTLGTKVVGDIEVTGIEDSYEATAYVGEHLRISPTVTTDYSDMSYEWLLLNGKTGTTTTAGDTIQPVVIGNSKDLDYEVATAPGTYQIRFIARSLSNGYTSYSSASLTVQTDFSQGFYIMKETADGNTELDLITTKRQLSENLMTAVKGAPLTGRPRRLDIAYGMYYVNPDNDEMEGSNAVSVTTENNDIVVSRTSDLQTMFDRSSLLFDDMDAGEKPYGIQITMLTGMEYVSSNGVRTCPSSDGLSSSPNTGKFGMPTASIGGSPFFLHDFNSFGGGLLWDETAHSIYALDYNAIPSALVYSDMTGEELTQNQTGWECLAVGLNSINGGSEDIVILNETATGTRRIFTAEGSFSGIYLTGCRTFAAGSAMATATAYSVSSISAKYLYGVSGGKVYACLFDEDGMPEVQLNPQGIGSGETISYIGNQIWESDGSTDPFDYLIVGTQNGQQYKLYFYNTVGGVPDGDPVMTFTGTGTVKSVKYLNSRFRSISWYGGPGFNQNN